MKNKIKTLFLAICATIAIGFDYVKYIDSKELFLGLKGCLKIGNLGMIVLFILLLQIFQKKDALKSWVINVLSAIFSLLMVFGASYMKYGTPSLVLGSKLGFIVSTIIIIGYYSIFKKLISYLYNYLNKLKLKESTNKLLQFYKKHPFIISLIIIILCWLPYIIAYYPIILSPDPSFQIKQFFGIRTKYADYAILLDENVVLTNHHPVAHTLLLGSCLKLGVLIGNDNFGLFIYSLIQIILLSGTLAYTIKYMLKDMKVPSKFGIICLLIYSLVPMFGVYAMSGVKDVLFSVFIIWYIILLHKVLNIQKDKIAILECLKMILIMILVILFRNNGLHIILLSFPFLIIAMKKNRKALIITFLITLLCSTCYTKVILPAFKITPGSVREMLSIPFQQTARLAKYHSEDLSESDIEAIDKILGYESLASRYNPELSDPVKNEYNKYATKDDLKKYFSIWFKGLIKHPNTYINATINNVYGFFYPEKTSWYLHTKYDTRIVDDGFDYHYNKLDDYRENVSEYVENYPKIPIIGLLTNIGLSTWIVFILVGYVIINKKYKQLILYLPALISILVCIAGPANTYFRYAMPYIFSLPLMASFVINKVNDKETNKV